MHNSWKVVSQMLVARSNCVVASLPGNRLMVGGRAGIGPGNRLMVGGRAGIGPGNRLMVGGRAGIGRNNNVEFASIA